MSDKKIYYVDDDPNWAYVLPEIGELIGMDIISAQSYEEFKEISSDQKMDLFITDIRLPDKDGYDLIIEERNSHPDVPVMIITAYDTEKVHNFVKENNVNGLLIKPFGVIELRNLLETILKN